VQERRSIEKTRYPHLQTPGETSAKHIQMKKKGERGGKWHPRESTRPETYKESKVGANQLCRQHCGQPYGVSTSQEEKWDRAGPPDHV
jgi:hypothetical protein